MYSLHVVLCYVCHVFTSEYPCVYHYVSIYNTCLCCTVIIVYIYQVNQTLPDRIIVFRDGVGDGQMYTVVEFEVPQIKKCFQMFG